MKLDLSKLRNVKHLSGGKITTQCPACAADGSDAKSEHLAIFANGKFGCVVYPKDKDHNKLIVKLAGSKDRGDSGSGCRLTVVPVRVEDSKVLMKVGQLGRVKPTLCQPDDKASSAGNASVDSPGVDKCPPERPGVTSVPVDNIAVDIGLSEDLTDEMLREFLELPVLTA